jgi:hypothetical protein
MKHLDFSLILPCYNESTHFKGSVAQILSSLSLSRFAYEVIFVDDGSTDETRKLIRQICRKNPTCRYIYHARNMGRGAAVTTGIRSAGAAIAGYIDIDCEVSPIYIPLCVQYIKNGLSDVVVGKRIYRTSVRSMLREVLSTGYRIAADRFLGTHGIDTESGYKFFDTKAFLPVLSDIQNQHWFWDTESILESLRHGLRVQEVPVLFLRRPEKKSSVRLVHDTIAYIQAIYAYCTKNR